MADAFIDMMHTEIGPNLTSQMRAAFQKFFANFANAMEVIIV